MYRKSLHLLALLCLALAFCTLFAACGSTIEPTDTTEETDDCLPDDTEESVAVTLPDDPEDYSVYAGITSRNGHASTPTVTRTARAASSASRATRSTSAHTDISAMQTAWLTLTLMTANEPG